MAQMYRRYICTVPRPVHLYRRYICTVPKRYISAAKKNFFNLSLKKNYKKVEFCFDPYKAVFKRILKLDEKNGVRH